MESVMLRGSVISDYKLAQQTFQFLEPKHFVTRKAGVFLNEHLGLISVLWRLILTRAASTVSRSLAAV